MTSFLLEQFEHNRTLKVLGIFFLVLSVWWVSMYARGLQEGAENDIFTIVYCIIALVGGAHGLLFAQKWGGFKSALGSSIAMFSLGLLAQFIGQIFYNYYIYTLGIEVPYPSIGDIAFFGSVVLYIIGAYKLAKVSGIKRSFHSVHGKLKAILIPAVVLLVSYVVLLQGYLPDFTNTLVTLLDFAYPIGQAIYVSIAILALLISKNILGGMMRKPIMQLIAALILQYLADFTFSYEVSREMWYVGGINDYLFAASYFAMALSLFSIGNMFYKVQES